MEDKENLNNSQKENEGKRKIVGFSKSEFKRYLVEWTTDAVVIYFIWQEFHKYIDVNHITFINILAVISVHTIISWLDKKIGD